MSKIRLKALINQEMMMILLLKVVKRQECMALILCKYRLFQKNGLLEQRRLYFNGTMGMEHRSKGIPHNAVERHVL